MNKSQELLKQLKQTESDEIVNYKKTIRKLIDPLNNQLFFSSKITHESYEEHPKFIFTIKLLDAQEDTLDFLTHSIQISFTSAKTDKQEDMIKVIKSNNLEVHYSFATLEASDVLEYLGNNVYFNCNSSSYSDVSQIISNIFDHYPTKSSNEKWLMAGKTKESLGGRNPSKEVYLHSSLAHKQLIPQIIKQLDPIRTNQNTAVNFKMMENKLQNDFLQLNLSISENKPRKPKI